MITTYFSFAKIDIKTIKQAIKKKGIRYEEDFFSSGHFHSSVFNGM